MSPENRIFGLDLLRATAILLVIFHHSLFFVTAPEWFNFFSPLGEVGVGALLVLSGYLIGQGLIKKSRDGRFSKAGHLGQFYLKRWLRTFPPYYFYLLMMAALFPPFLQQLTAHKEYFFFMQNFAWNIPPFYCQTWTLTLLEFFYFLFPLVLFLTSGVVPNYQARILIAMALLLVIPLALRAMHTQIETPDGFEQTFRKWVVYRIDTPIIGVGAAMVQFEVPRLWAWFLRHTWIGLCAFSGYVIYQLLGCPFLFSSHWMQVFFYPAAALTMAPLLPFLCEWKKSRTPLGSMMSSVSAMSYTIYVSHFFAFIVGFCLLSVLGIPHNQWLLAYPFFILLIGLIAWPSYHLVEEPFIRLRESGTTQSSLLLALYRAAFPLVRSFFAARLFPVAPSAKASEPSGI